MQKEKLVKLMDHLVSLERRLKLCEEVDIRNLLKEAESTELKAAMLTKGGSGPSGLDADGWRKS